MTDDQPHDLPPDPPRTEIPPSLRAVLERFADPRHRTPGVSHAEIAVMAARAAAMVHPMPKDGDDVPPHAREIAHVFNLAAMLADAIGCTQHAIERLQRDVDDLSASVLTLQNRVHPEALYVRELSDGRVITVYQHNARQYGVGVGAKDSGFIEDNFYYTTREAALHAAVDWSGRGDAPVGWFRHPQSGRRRKDGDPARERVQP